jgi:YD repeat-containing protein
MGYADPDAVTLIANGLSTTTYTYDNNGNLTSVGNGTATTTYTYDYANLLTALFAGVSRTRPITISGISDHHHLESVITITWND